MDHLVVQNLPIPPSDILVTPGTLDRSLNVGDSVGTLSAVDTFPRDTFTFALTGIGKDRFRLQGNEVQLIKATTPSDSGPFQLGLRVSDSYGANFAKVITINLTDNQADNDTDDLPDAWEQSNFGDLTQTGSSDFDGDGKAIPGVPAELTPLTLQSHSRFNLHR